MKNDQELLNKYWQAETSLEEEQFLQKHYANTADNDLFKAYCASVLSYRNGEAPDQLESKINSQIQTNKGLFQKIIQFVPVRAVAASLFIIMASTVLMMQYSSYKQKQFLYTDTFQSSDQAWHALLTAFENVSEHMDNGTDLLTSELLRIGEVQEFEQ